MSKERELLKTILAYMAAEYLVITEFEMITQIEDTVKEIQELLAQPEKEGVYQKLLRIEDGIEVEILPSELWQDGYETGRKDPPIREPLSDSELNVIYYEATDQTLREQDMRLALGFARGIEKAHGIGGEE